MDPALMELDIGEKTPVEEPHEGEEFGLVIGGSIDLILGGKTFKLKKGRMFLF